MISDTNDLPAADTRARIASAAGAVLITTIIVLAVGLGFPAYADAQGVQRATGSQPAPKTGGVKVATAATPGASVERGRYLVSISGCNDCHTAGYAENGGTTAQAEWLTGLPVGFRGPWGVSYPANLRLTVQAMSETEWLRYARVERLPPMPWFALRDMSDEDLRSVYRFIRDLGPKGVRMPAAVAPNGKVATPYIQFTPQNVPASAVSQANPPPRQGGQGVTHVRTR